MKYLFILFAFCSCSSTNEIQNGLSSQAFKNRALCQCIVSGLDSARENYSIQKLVPYDPVSAVLYDTVIFESLKPVLKEMYIDSADRAGRMAEAAQGKPGFYFCMRYYKSKELDKLARQQIKIVKRTKNLEEYISSEYPAW